jgi:hypothetical protein
VLGHSIDTVCKKSLYKCEKVAFVAPDVPAESVAPLAQQGWRVLVRAVPLDITTIKGDRLRNRIDKSGCCGGERDVS